MILNRTAADINIDHHLGTVCKFGNDFVNCLESMSPEIEIYIFLTITSKNLEKVRPILVNIYVKQMAACETKIEIY